MLTMKPCETYKHLSLFPDICDIDLHRRNCSSDLITNRLRKNVPLLAFLNCVVEKVSQNKTVLSVPLISAAMNQNGTHQSSVFYLIGDYTLGLGMFAALPGVYVTGIHDYCDGLPVQFWLKYGSVQHIAPGTGTLSAEVSILPEKAQNLRQQLIDRGRAEMIEIVRICQNGRLVAETKHSMGLYANIPSNPFVRAIRRKYRLSNMPYSDGKHDV